MTEIASVTLELLRLGPPHNQLLSPLTRYIGVCGNHRAEEVLVPWEHREFLARLEQLRYDDPRASRVGEPTQAADRDRVSGLLALGHDMVRVLGHIEGLKNRLSEAHARNGEGLTHLEIVLSASELAMLPFELTRSFPGAPGSDEQFLLVQPSVQIEITRRVRGVLEGWIEWPRLPKILFIAACPEGMTIPFDEHLDALLEVLRPFLAAAEGAPEDLPAIARKYVHVLPNASIDQIERLCRQEQFSYVHVLAHGMESPSRPGSPYGLALHSPEDPARKEIVTGDRLAAALGVGDQRPAIVTLAACDSGTVREVIHNGASLAHELHCAGLPLVIGSQFPLSFDGSIELVKEIYARLPWGEDPREVVHALRRRLYARLGARTHDWASLIVYASLPSDLGQQLRHVHHSASQAALDATITRLDRVLDAHLADGDETKLVAELEQRVSDTLERLPSAGEWAIQAEAMRGTMTKRLAQTFFAAGCKHEPSGRASWWERSLVQLRAARRGYAKAAQLSLMHPQHARVQVAVHWVMIQELSLDAVLGRPFERDRWSTALVAARTELDHGDERAEIGALTGLVELYLLLLSRPDGSGVCDPATARARALAYVDQLVDQAGEGDYMLYSTRRQLQRYVEWLWHPDWIAFSNERGIERDAGNGELVALARELVGRLPAE